jgi:hypothetical protein
MKRMRRRVMLGAMLATAAAAAWSGRRHLALGVSRARDATGPDDRVAAARVRVGTLIRKKVEAAGIAWPPREIFLRATKYDDDGGRGHVEVWGGDGRGPLACIDRYPLCALSGSLGPKRREGDGQIPEGLYRITALNPRSAFHLSLRVDYPNASDRVRNRRLDPSAPLGGDIMVHGSCVTIGCLPIEDGPIEEVYLLVNEVFGRAPVSVFIYPRPMNDEGLAALMATSVDTETKALWTELAASWQAFETTRRVPEVRFEQDGRAVVRPKG